MIAFHARSTAHRIDERSRVDTYTPVRQSKRSRSPWNHFNVSRGLA